jgi:hypothetical protein
LYKNVRVGNKAFADYLNNQEDMVVARVVNDKDIVCQLPVANGGWFHHGTEIWLRAGKEDKICSRDVYEDPTCQYSVMTTPSLYNHMNYWNVSFLNCPTENPTVLLSQFFL